MNVNKLCMSEILYGLLFFISGVLVLIWAVKRDKNGTFWDLNYSIPMTGVVCLVGGVYIIVRTIIEMYK
jgi:hypothetical protein